MAIPSRRVPGRGPGGRPGWSAPRTTGRRRLRPARGGRRRPRRRLLAADLALPAVTLTLAATSPPSSSPAWPDSPPSGPWPPSPSPSTPSSPGPPRPAGRSPRSAC
ncbi:hypothetical protein ACFQVA_16355 [Actinomadura keratinilytica]